MFRLIQVRSIKLPKKNHVQFKVCKVEWHDCYLNYNAVMIIFLKTSNYLFYENGLFLIISE